MSEWWTYRPSNFLMFSGRVYYRLFELYNQELWPAQVLAVALGLTVLYLIVRGGRTSHRTVWAILGALWVLVAWAYLWKHFATINWPIAYAAPVFAAQGLLLIGIGAIGGGLAFPQTPGRGIAGAAGLALFAASVALYPFLAPLMGRPWESAEVFGLAPDPTAAATLALIAIADGRARWLLMIVPCLWCAISAMTLWLLGSPGFIVPLAAAIAALVIAAAKSGRRPSPQFASNP
jgi:hypothetical protein